MKYSVTIASDDADYLKYIMTFAEVMTMAPGDEPPPLNDFRTMYELFLDRVQQTLVNLLEVDAVDTDAIRAFSSNAQKYADLFAELGN